MYYLVKRRPWEQIPAEALSTGCTYAWLIVYAIVFGALGLRWRMKMGRRGWAAWRWCVREHCMSRPHCWTQRATHTATLPAGTANSTAILLAHFSLLTAIGFFPSRAAGCRRPAQGLHRSPSQSKVQEGQAGQSASRRRRAGNDVILHEIHVSRAYGSLNRSGQTRPGRDLSHEDDDEEDDDSDDARYEGLSRSDAAA